MYKFAAANNNESIVYGSARPRYNQKAVMQWLKFMQQQEIQRVCCLLEEKQLARYQVDGNHLKIFKCLNHKY